MIYRVFLIVASIAITIAYFLAPSAKGFARPESARILFFHAPEAMLSSVFFLWSAIMGARYLLKRDPAFDARSLAAAEVGFLLCSLATVTGAVFAYEQWGVAWDWDPRQVTIFAQLLIYAAYFALRAGFASREQGAANSAAYSIFAFVTVPFLIWILPRLPQFSGKHSGANQAVVGGGLDSTYRAIFYGCVVVIGLVAIWCYKLRVARLEEERNDTDMGSIDTAGARVVSPVRLRGGD